MSANDFVFSTLIAHHPDPAKASRALQLAEAEVLRAASNRLRDERGPHRSRAIFCEGIQHSAARLALWADEAGEKSSREATATPQPGDPLTVRWDRTVIHPEADPTDDTIVCCLADDGRPVALFLDDEHREALGLLLVDPAGEDEPQLTGRRAQLLDAIRTWPGQWTTTRAMAVYRAQGLQDPNRSTARGDLQALTETGHLVCCGPENDRYYLLARKDGNS